MEHGNLDFTINLADTEASTKSQAIPLAPQPQIPKVQPVQYQPSPAPKSTSACSILTVDYWKEYFDVTESEILSKFKAGLNPTTNIFEQLIDQKVDLYGPFWISTTLIFAMIVAPRLWSVLFFQDITFDISKIGFAFTLIYGGLGVFTFVFFGVSKFMGISVPLFRTAAIYGYSYSVFLAAALGTILSMSFFNFIFAMAAGVHSVLFLLKNFRSTIEKLDATNRLLSIGFIVVMQLFMTLMIYFHYLR